MTDEGGLSSAASLRGSTPARFVTVVVTHDAATCSLTSLPPSGTSRVAASIVVVDNGSRDGTRALLPGRDDVTVIEQDDTGYAHAVNRGVEAATASHDILDLNPAPRYRDLGRR